MVTADTFQLQEFRSVLSLEDGFVSNGKGGNGLDSGNVEQQHSWLRRRARRLMGSRLRGWTESVDLAQQVQVEALRTYDQKIFPNLAALRGWLLRILSNLAATESRRRGIEQVVGEGTEVPGRERSPSRALEVRDSGVWMRTRLDSISGREREIVLARIVDNLSFSEIGQRRGIEEGNARVIFHRALQKLRGDDGPESPA